MNDKIMCEIAEKFLRTIKVVYAFININIVKL